MAFSGAGKDEGITVWRIVDFEAEPVPKKQHGKFFTGDCYIVLQAARKSRSDGLEYTVFFWLGAESSQDERGTAAIKAVELDDALGGRATQSREVQGHESPEWKGLFKSAQYLQGGAKSGFNHVDRSFHETRLFQLKGAKQVGATQVALKASAMNSGDVFVLEAKDIIYTWHGKESNIHERAAGLDFARKLRDEDQELATIEPVDEGDEPDGFWKLLGGKGRVGPPTPDTGASAIKVPEIYRVTDSTGSIKVSKVDAGPGPLLSRSVLDPLDVFIVDAGAEIYVWVGDDASPAERKSGMDIASSYVDQQQRPSFARVKRVVDGGEPPAFKAKFVGFYDPPAAPNFAGPPRGNVAPTPPKLSAAELAAQMSKNASQAESPLTNDDGSGEVKVWRVRAFEKVPVPEEHVGEFYEGDCYVVHYKYMDEGEEKHIVYFWLGRDSTSDEKGSAAVLAARLDDSLGGQAVQVRLEQGKETEHFLRIFKKWIVVRFGGFASGYKNRNDQDEYDDDGVELFHVKGFSKSAAYGVQVPEEASSLNSGDCFVLITKAGATLWAGTGSSADERDTAHKIAKHLARGKPVTEVPEGKEPKAFWDALGGKGEYAKVKVPLGGQTQPRLFEVSNRTGAVRAEEITAFSQGDLLSAEVYVLDAGSTVFLWVGSQASDAEKRSAPDLAQEYLRQQKRKGTAVVSVKEGHEPPLFTANFRGWDRDKAAPFVDPYEEKLRRLKEENRRAETKRGGSRAASSSSGNGASGGGGHGGGHHHHHHDKGRDKPRDKGARDYVPPSPAPPGDAPWAKQELKAAPKKPPDIVARAVTARPDPSQFARPGELTLSLEQLKDKRHANPKVDPANKEMYLSDSDFQRHMGCSKSEWASVKAWRRADIKKKLGIF